MSMPDSYTEDQFVEQLAIQFFTESLPRLLSGQLELVDFFDKVLP